MKLAKLTLLVLAAATTMSLNAQKTTRAEYFERYKDIAVAHAEKYGIPASIKMAQGMLESDNGNSRLATEARNHFGIKCKSDWTGRTLYADDDALGECFRAYRNDKDSWVDHSEFLDNGARYQSLFELSPTDYKGWAYGLKAAGYATNPRYPELLIEIIETNRLYLLDEGQPVSLGNIASNENARHNAEAQQNVPYADKIDVDNYTVAMYNHNGYEIYSNNGSRFIVAREGDNLHKISWLFGISEGRLRKFNDLGKMQNITGGNMVYIQTKNRRSDTGHIIHTAKSGETLHSISQLYGIRAGILARLNRLDPGSSLIDGQQIKLQ